MRKTVTAIGISTLTTIVGCAANEKQSPFNRGLFTQTTYQRDSVDLETPGNIKNQEIRRITQDDSHYQLQGVIINETAFYEEKNFFKQDPEFGTYLVRKHDHTRQIDRTAGTTTIASDTLYIPTKVVTSSGEIAHTLKLNPDGDYAIKANMKLFKTTNVQTGIFRETQEDAKLNIRTITLGGVECYVPRIEQRANGLEQAAQANVEEQQDALGFYIVPVEGTRIDIANNGAVSLWSRQGVFRPIKTTRDAYNKRSPKDTTVPADQNPGQALEPTS